MKPKFFSAATKFREWLERNHDTANELLIGFHKKSSGKKSITYAEALDEALCFGWIDGVRRNLDGTSYEQRFTPRRAKSIWSLVNLRHVDRLIKEGRMRSAGLEAFAKRDPKRTGIYSFENAPRQLTPAYERRFRRNKAAWEFFAEQAPYFRKGIVNWVMSAKKEETQQRRLERVIESSAKGIKHGVIVAKKKD
jgi:uncharacterized protein YdeI (YjbR/CyaY-like superfamily)